MVSIGSDKAAFQTRDVVSLLFTVISLNNVQLIVKKHWTRRSGLNASCYDRPVLAERFDTKKKNNQFLSTMAMKVS